MDSETLNGLSIHDDGEGALRLVGEIDLATTPELQRHLHENPGVKVIDMRHVSFIDCRGISILVLANRTRALADRITIHSPSAQVRRVLRLTGLDTSFDIHN
jgi:anti-anti-sigma factor